MPPLLRLPAALLFAAAALLPGAARAQPAAELVARLPALTGAERGRALAQLTEAYKGDDPTRALVYGREALQLFVRTPDDSAHVATLDEMAWAYMTLAQYDSAVAFAERGRRVGERTG